jgi:hypothetical protein
LWTRLKGALAATLFWTLDSNEKPQLMLDGSGMRGRRAAGRIASNDDRLTARSAISASCSSNWPDRTRLTNISNIRRHSRSDHKIETYGLGDGTAGRRAPTL